MTDQFTEATKGLDEFRDVNVRATSNGYVITGQRRWLNAQGVAQVSQQLEAVATDDHEAVVLVSNFLAGGSFLPQTLDIEKAFARTKPASKPVSGL